LESALLDDVQTVGPDALDHAGCGAYVRQRDVLPHERVGRAAIEEDYG
jgi:hypothetical protein